MDDVARYDPGQQRVSTGENAGQFGSGSSPQSQAAQAADQRRRLAAATLSYDARRRRGTGYGKRGGDPRVRALQQALNRLGFTDGSGRSLRVDGEYGPLTTDAVRKAQQKLGVPADGKVTPALLRQIVEAAGWGAAPKPAAQTTKPKATTKPRAPAPRKTAPKKAPPADTPPKKTASGWMARGLTMVNFYDRSFPLDDIQISRSGDGRTVEAYAAMFDMPYEVRDQQGHYQEIIDRAAFNRTLRGGAGTRAMCLYNHGFTVHGTPSEMGSVPLGTPLEIRADGRGLLTVTRYNKGPFADQVLEAIRNGDIRAQSFRGRIVRSNPNGKAPRPRPGQPLPTITRHELGLTDYGPTPIPVNQGAEIVAVRSVQELLADLQDLDPDERFELLRNLGVDLAEVDGETTDHEDEDQDPVVEPVDDEATELPATPEHSGPGAEDPPHNSTALRSAHQALQRRIRVAMLTRSMR